jgi:hypothetical protein
MIFGGTREKKTEKNLGFLCGIRPIFRKGGEV